MVIDVADETLRCWCTTAEGLLRAMLPYAIRSFNASIAESRRLFADRLIADVGLALVAFHAGEIVSDAEREAARRIAAGLKMDDVTGLVDELGAVAVTRGLLVLRDLIQRLNAQAKRDANRANEG
jgi:hypothetical protein